MTDRSTDVQDKRVLDVAAEVTEANEKRVPQVLLTLQDVLDSYPRGSRPLQQVKLDIWAYDLLPIVLTTLQQDFSKVDGAWDTAAKLAALLCNCCIGLDPPDSQQFKDIFLHNTIECLLTLCRKLQARYIRTANVLQDKKKELLGNLQSVTNLLSLLYSAHDFLVLTVLQSPWLLQMLITDDAETAVVIMGCVQSANRMVHGVFGNLEEKLRLGLLDEFVYKLSASTSVLVAGSSTRTLLVICDSQPDIVEILCSRYRGLRPLLTKWRDQGFNRDLSRLVLLLETGNMQKAEHERLNHAASKIQAAWKSWSTRTRLHRANKAFSKFQRSFRTMKEVRYKQKEEEKWQTELEHMLLMQRKRAMRDLHQRRLAALQLLPAGEINRHLCQEQQKAAMCIQTTWRGYRIRKGLHTHRQHAHKVKAAVTIQRAVRKWLSRRKAPTEPPAWQLPPGLTDTRRVQIQSEIMERRENHPVPQRSREEQEMLHQKVQMMLQRHVSTSRTRRKQEQHRDALLAGLHLDAGLLLNAPKLDSVTQEEIKLYSSSSMPVATKAKFNHNHELRLLRQPWWKKLGDEYQDGKLEEEAGDGKLF